MKTEQRMMRKILRFLKSEVGEEVAVEEEVVKELQREGKVRMRKVPNTPIKEKWNLQV